MPDTKVRPTTALFSALTVAFVVVGLWDVAHSADVYGFILLALALVPLGAAWALMNADGPESF